MKRTNKAFTLVELIIVIAVIGVLAAILVPVFANVIEKANNKSALSDAKNALEIYLAEKTDGTGVLCIGEGSVFKVRKANKDWYYTYYENALHEGTGAEGSDPSQPLPIPANSIKVMSANSYYIGEQDAETEICDNLPDTVIIYNTGADATYTPPAPQTPADTPQTRMCTVNLYCRNYDETYYFSGYGYGENPRPMLVTNNVELAVGDNEIPFEQIKASPWYGWRGELKEYEQNNRGWKIVQVEQGDTTLTPKVNIIVHLDSLSQDTVNVNVYTAFVRRSNASADNSLLNSGRHHVELICWDVVNAAQDWVEHVYMYYDLEEGTNRISTQEIYDSGILPPCHIEGCHWEIFGVLSDKYATGGGAPVPEESELPDTSLSYVEIELDNESFVETEKYFCWLKPVPNVDSFPVYRVSPHDVTGDELIIFTKAVVGTDELYDIENHRTKSVIMNEIQYYQDCVEADKKKYNETADEIYKTEADSIEKRIEALQKEYACAPAELDSVHKEIQFHTVERSGIKSEEFCGYTKDCTSCVSAVKNNNTRKASEMLYSSISYTREHIWETPETDRSGARIMGSCKLCDNLNDINLSYADAKSTADEYVHKTLGYEDVEMNIAYSVYCLPKGYTDEDWIIKEHKSTADCPQKYAFIYTKTVSGIPVCYFMPGSQDSEKDYSPTWSQHCINIIVDDKGIFSVNEESAFDIKKKLSDNVSLLPFEKIQNVFREYASVSSEYDKLHMVYDNMNDAGEEAKMYYDTVELTVKDIRLGYIRTKEKNGDITDGLLIPAWFFYGDQTNTYYVQASDVGRKNKLKTKSFDRDVGRCFMCINAIDGSIIDLSQSY